MSWQVLLVALLRRWQPKAVSTFELLSLAVPLPDLLSHWLVCRAAPAQHSASWPCPAALCASYLLPILQHSCRLQ